MTNLLIEYIQRFLNTDNPGKRAELQIEFRKRLIDEEVSVEDAHIATAKFHYAFLQKDDAEKKRYLSNAVDILNKYDRTSQLIDEYGKYIEHTKHQPKPEL